MRSAAYFAEVSALDANEYANSPFSSSVFHMVRAPPSLANANSATHYSGTKRVDERGIFRERDPHVEAHRAFER